MAYFSATCIYQDGGLRSICIDARRPHFSSFKSQFVGSLPAGVLPMRVGFKNLPKKSFSCIKCEKKEEEESIEVTVERFPYTSYFDSTSGQLEPASGARASIPGEEYWPEGTADRVRAARAPEPTGKSTGSPSYGKLPGSRRKKYKTSAATSESSEVSLESSVQVEPAVSEDTSEDTKDSSSEYVVYEAEPVEEELTGYDLDKKIGRPHPFIDPKVKKPIEGTLSSEELWWNWRKPEQEQWSRWQRRRPDVETVFLKAMAETAQIKLYGEHPTLTETALYRARRHLYKEERLQAEQERLERIGPIAYYSEWVKAWKRDTSREAIQKHYEETGEDENMQLIEMFSHQTDREFRIMMGTDVRIKRDPLAMRMREDQIKQIWGGDPVYPTVNYIQDPDEIIDYRGPEFHEPTPDMLAYLKEHGKIITREELEKILAKEKTEEIEVTDIDEAMAQAVDIGEKDDEGEDSDVDGDDAEEEPEKINRNWSVLKSNPQLKNSKSQRRIASTKKGGSEITSSIMDEARENFNQCCRALAHHPIPEKAKPKKDSMSIEEAIGDSENLTDFLLDFDEEE